jgi:hypothetical protein
VKAGQVKAGMGQFGTEKIYKKSSHFAAHGTHSVDPGVLKSKERERLKRPKPEMFPSVAEAFQAAKKKK